MLIELIEDRRMNVFAFALKNVLMLVPGDGGSADLLNLFEQQSCTKSADCSNKFQQSVDLSFLMGFEGLGNR